MNPSPNIERAACEHVRANAAGLAALSASDPDRRDAEEHASSCSECAEELAQGSMVWELLGRMPEPEPPAAAVLQRVAESVNSEMDRDLAQRAIWLTPLATLVGFGVLLAIYPPTGRPLLGVGGLLVALLLSAAVFRLGWPLVIAAVGTSTGLSLLAAGPASTPPIAGCLLVEVGAGALPLAIVTVLALRQRVARVTPGRFAAAAAAGALAGQAALHIACPGHALTHLLIFHTGGVIVAGLVALLIARHVRSATVGAALAS